MEAGIGYPIDDKTYAEAVQIFCERSRDEWNHTAQTNFYICDVHRDPKKGPKLSPEQFNPWGGHKRKKKGVPLKTDNFSILRGLTNWRK